MRILVKSANERTIHIILPSGLILNNLTATLGTKVINKYINQNCDSTVNITSHDVRKLVQEIRRLKRKYPNWYLVDIESSDGDVVKIKL